MKKLLIYLMVFISVHVFAQDAKYMKAMENNIAILDSAKDPVSIQNACNAFERIGNANQTEWLPFYYESYCNVMMGMRQSENSKKDEYYDKAQQLIDRADSISPDNSEIYV